MASRGRVKATKELIADRVDQVSAALGSFEAPSSIIIRLADAWKVEPRTVQAYVERAQEKLKQYPLAMLTPSERAQRQNQVIAGIEHTVRLSLEHVGKGGRVSLGGLQRAQKGLEMLGQIYGAFKHDIDVTSGGQPLQTTGAAGLRDMLERLLREAKAKRDREAKKDAPAPEGATP